MNLVRLQWKLWTLVLLVWSLVMVNDWLLVWLTKGTTDEALRQFGGGSAVLAHGQTLMLPTYGAEAIGVSTLVWHLFFRRRSEA